ncbi:hypothetical protein [Absidia glauca]|uniref:TLC domain-containing protein n=1 Tax=Absidia glauca TaxID=4829 RepID=A0A163K5A8_ABSGL|nr:hypothetical protein [Absidia glauca]
MATLPIYYITSTKLTLSQVVCQPIVPLSFAASFLGLGLYFYLSLALVAKTEKQISWVLTFASSVVCTIVSIPYYMRFWRSGWDMQLLGTESAVHTALVCFFITYLVLDLTLGSMYYRRRITIATGWIHHSIYIVILFWLMRCRSASFFTVNAILELPTVILAVGSMRARWRSDLLFASTFFALRLVYHAWMISAVKKEHRIESLWLVAVLVFPLHVYWFYGIVILQVKRIRSAFSSPVMEVVTQDAKMPPLLHSDSGSSSSSSSSGSSSNNTSEDEDDTSTACKAAALAAYQQRHSTPTTTTTWPSKAIVVEHRRRRYKSSFLDKVYTI